MTKKWNNIAYCHTCIQPLFDYGEIATYVYMGVCEHYICRGYSVPIDKDECARGTLEITKFLEMKSFLTTTEIERNVIMAKPNNYHFNEKFGHLYCSDPKMHCPRWYENDIERIGK